MVYALLYSRGYYYPGLVTGSPTPHWPRPALLISPLLSSYQYSAALEASGHQALRHHLSKPLFSSLLFSSPSSPPFSPLLQPPWPPQCLRLSRHAPALRPLHSPQFRYNSPAPLQTVTQSPSERTYVRCGPTLNCKALLSQRALTTF